MKYLIMLLLISPQALSESKVTMYEKQDEILQQIIVNKPEIDIRHAMRLSYFIVHESAKVGINPQLFAAILMQESSYQLGAKNCKDTEAGYEICTDYGLSQIHYKTVALYGFDKKKLTTDMEYSIKAGLRVLSDFKKRYGNKEIHYWTRYNSSNPKARKKYQERVERWL